MTLCSIAFVYNKLGYGTAVSVGVWSRQLPRSELKSADVLSAGGHILRINLKRRVCIADRNFNYQIDQFLVDKKEGQLFVVYHNWIALLSVVVAGAGGGGR
jgi:hypothetical protein